VPSTCLGIGINTRLASHKCLPPVDRSWVLLVICLEVVALRYFSVTFSMESTNHMVTDDPCALKCEMLISGSLLAAALVTYISVKRSWLDLA